MSGGGGGVSVPGARGGGGLSSLLALATSHTPGERAWEDGWALATPELEALARGPFVQLEPLKVLRVSQLDALRLDSELMDLLKEQFSRIFSLFRPGLLGAFKPELVALMETAVWWFTVRDSHTDEWYRIRQVGKATPGSVMMNLRYRDEGAATRRAGGWGGLWGRAEGEGSGPAHPPVVGGRSGVEGPLLSSRQRVAYWVLAIGVRYAWKRAMAMRWAQEATQAAARRVARVAEAAWSAASFGNLVIFLWEGKYRSVVERLLAARLVYERPTAVRAISMEYLNRQLVWHELSEVLLYVLPIINTSKLKRWLTWRVLPMLRLATSPVAEGGGGAAGTAGGGAVGGCGEGDKGQGPCPICEAAEVGLPFQALPCRHVFCFYCLRSHCMDDPAFSCPRCSERVVAMERYLPARVGAGVGDLN